MYQEDRDCLVDGCDGNVLKDAETGNFWCTTCDKSHYPCKGCGTVTPHGTQYRIRPGGNISPLYKFCPDCVDDGVPEERYAEDAIGRTTEF